MLKLLLIILSVSIAAVLFAKDKIEAEPLRSWLARKMEKGDQHLLEIMNEGLKSLLIKHAGYFRRLFIGGFVAFGVTTCLGFDSLSSFLACSACISLLGWEGLSFFLLVRDKFRSFLKNEIVIVIAMLFICLAFRLYQDQERLTGLRHLDLIFPGGNFWIWALAILSFLILIAYAATWLGAALIVVGLGIPLFLFQCLLFAINKFASPQLTYFLLGLLNVIILAILRFL